MPVRAPASSATLRWLKELAAVDRGSRAVARAQLSAHLQAGAAEPQRLLDLLARRKEREATGG